MRDLGKAVVEPEVKGVWCEENWGYGQCHFGKKSRDVIPICVLPVKGPGHGLQEQSRKHN